MHILAKPTWNLYQYCFCRTPYKLCVLNTFYIKIYLLKNWKLYLFVYTFRICNSLWFWAVFKSYNQNIILTTTKRPAERAANVAAGHCSRLNIWRSLCSHAWTSSHAWPCRRRTKLLCVWQRLLWQRPSDHRKPPEQKAATPYRPTENGSPVTQTRRHTLTHTYTHTQTHTFDIAAGHCTRIT